MHFFRRPFFRAVCFLAIKDQSGALADLGKRSFYPPSSAFKVDILTRIVVETGVGDNDDHMLPDVLATNELKFWEH